MIRWGSNATISPTPTINKNTETFNAIADLFLSIVFLHPK
jgi:hypothetical protein